MTPKKSFLIVLRIIFVLFFIIFLKETFYRWDDYSYYIRFTDLLPDLSLIIILWTIIGITIAAILWLILYGIFRLIPKFLIPIRLEHLLAFFILILLPLFVKRTFFSGKSLSYLLGLEHSILLITGSVLVAIIVWVTRKYTDKILYSLNERITPLVWLFTILLIIAVPLTVFEELKSLHSPFTKGGHGEIIHEGAWDEKRPNIILVVMDALTARDMQLYGYNRPTTPFISEWAKDAVVFSKVYSDASYTTPATMSLLTGQRQWTHGIWYFARYFPVKNYPKSLPEVLKDNGYNVYGFIQNDHAHPDTLGMKNAFSVRDKSHIFWLSSGWWFDRIKDLFNDRPVVQEAIFRNNPIANNILSHRPFIDFTLVPSEIIYNRFLEFIPQIQAEKPRKPFFAYLHVYPPHARYIPPKPYRGIFGDAKIEASETEPILEYRLDAQPEVDKVRNRYDEFILYSDKEFEKFMSHLAEKIDMSNTIVILTSDHGESFSHGYQSHGGPHLYEPFVHIPLIIRMPAGVDPYRDGTNSKIIDILVGQIDIAPTILEFANISIPEWMEGRSLIPLLNAQPIEQHPIFSAYLQTNHSFGYPITKGTIAVWEGDYKLIYYLDEKRKLLFNLRADPDETHNILDKEPEIAERLMKLIEDGISCANKRIAQAK